MTQEKITIYYSVDKIAAEVDPSRLVVEDAFREETTSVFQLNKSVRVHLQSVLVQHVGTAIQGLHEQTSLFLEDLLDVREGVLSLVLWLINHLVINVVVHDRGLWSTDTIKPRNELFPEVVSVLLDVQDDIVLLGFQNSSSLKDSA